MINGMLQACKNISHSQKHLLGHFLTAYCFLNNVIICGILIEWLDHSLRALKGKELLPLISINFFVHEEKQGDDTV